MTNNEKLQSFIENGNGIILTKELVKADIHHNALLEFVKQGKLERVAHGVYITPDTFNDTMYVLQQRKSLLIYSHETALFLHDLTDRDPINYSVTVPTGYNTKKLLHEGFSVFSIKKDMHTLGEIEVETMFGHNVHTYNMERTICDVIRSRNQMDIAVVTDAAKRYAKRNDKDLNLLMQYAEKFKVTKFVRNYMEVLL